jgi:hypothetical protein
LDYDLSLENITMKFSITSLTCILVLALSAIVRAEIYQSKDADGNPVFTDTPSAGAEKVDLPQENIADAVEVPPEAEAAKASGSPSTFKKTTGHGKVIVIPNSRNERLERELAADRPREVGDNPTAEEMERREEARTGEYVDEEGNTVRVEHRGHAK